MNMSLEEVVFYTVLALLIIFGIGILISLIISIIIWYKIDNEDDGKEE